MNHSNDWGQMKKSANVRYDLFQSFIEKDTLVGFQLILAPIRGQRPREQYPKTKNDSQSTISEDNVLTKIAQGLDEAIVISTSEKFLSDPFSKLDVTKNNWDEVSALSVVNKFSIFSRFDTDGNKGVMLVVFPTRVQKYPRENPENTAAIIKAISSSVRGILSIHGDMRLATFFNIGSKSGSSLIQLHAQVYLFQGVGLHVGSNEYTYNRSFSYHKENGICLSCLLASGKKDPPVLGDALDPQRAEFLNADLTLWEDDNVILRSAFAPLRYAHLRIFLKKHIAHIGELTPNESRSLGYAISIGDHLMKEILGTFWGTIPENDRSIVIRQRSDDDFHMFVDMLPVYMGLGGAELILPLSIHSKKPEQFAELMRAQLESLPEIFRV